MDRWRARNSGSGLNDKDSVTQQMIEDFKLYLDSTPNVSIYKNLEDETIQGKCAVIDLNAENNYGDEKYITTLPDSKLNIGDYVVFEEASFCKEGTIWMVTLEEGLAVPSHKKFKVTPCNNKVNVLSDGEIVSIPIRSRHSSSKMQNYSNDVHERTSLIIDYADSKLIFEVRMEIAKKYFREGQRILLPHLNTAKAYKIELIDCAPVSKVTIFAKQGVLVEEDDIENMIAFNGEKKELHKEVEEVSIIGEDSIIKEGIYKVNLEGLTFKLDDEELASIEMLDSKTCKIKGKKKRQYVQVIVEREGEVVGFKDILIKEV